MSRKYRQRGYRDEDVPERDRRESVGERPERDGPRGRGLGKPTATVTRCARCGRRLDGTAPIAVDATCPGCGGDLHTCTNCRHFDTSARFQCREDIPAPVSSKARRNDCDLFAPRLAQETAREQPSAADARTEFDDLFDL